MNKIPVLDTLDRVLYWIKGDMSMSKMTKSEFWNENASYYQVLTAGHKEEYHKVIDSLVKFLFDGKSLYGTLGNVDFNSQTAYIVSDLGVLPADYIKEDIFIIRYGKLLTEHLPEKCSCGAAYTSRPSFHLKFCSKA